MRPPRGGLRGCVADARTRGPELCFLDLKLEIFFGIDRKMESRSATDLRGFAPDSRRGPSPSSLSFGSRMSLNPYAADARGVSRGPGSSCVGRGAGAGRRCRRLGAVSCQPFGFRLDCRVASSRIGPVPGAVPSAGGHPETGRLACRRQGDPTRPLHLRDRRGSFQAVPGPAPQP